MNSFDVFLIKGFTVEFCISLAIDASAFIFYPFSSLPITASQNFHQIQLFNCLFSCPPPHSPSLFPKA